MTSLALLAREVPKDDLLGALCQFMDDFARADDRYQLIVDEPQWESQMGRWPYDFAAVAHKLAHDYGVKVPEWVFAERYISPVPLYAFDTSNPVFQDYLRATTPEEYCYHNLFLGEHVGMRA